MERNLNIRQLRRIAKKMNLSIKKLRDTEFFVLLDLNRQTVSSDVMTISKMADWLEEFYPYQYQFD